ncbi:MAG: CPBP family intramembrane metalloprotease [Anaerolineae bacterium]|nr:CPBP family intramembrane metalloprotease [Anaerolineae bacterium]
MSIPPSARGKIVTFLLLTFAFSSVFWMLSLRAGSIRPYVLGIMWCPGLAAIITQLVYERTLRGLGWQRAKPRYLGISYAVPLVYTLLGYGLVWATGLGGFPNLEAIAAIQRQYAPSASPFLAMMGYVAVMATVGVALNCVSALGEEIGWRGLLVPELVKHTSFTRAALLSGLIWAAWHYPGIFLLDYTNPGVPRWYAALCFTVLVVAISVIVAWLRLKSGSLWTAVIFHSAHNLFIQAVFTPFTSNTGPTPYFIDEFGLVVPSVAAVIAYLVWRRRGELSLPEPPTAPRPIGPTVRTPALH